MKEKGFTLIEILVVISILGLLGFIFTNLLTQIFRGQNKIRIVNQVKQNGQVVLEKLSNEIRQAERVICIGKYRGSNDTLVVFREGIYTRFRFYPQTSSQNGYFAQDSWDYDKGQPPDGDCTLEDQPSDRRSNITDTDPVNGVSIVNDSTEPIFKKLDPKIGFPEMVAIKFRAYQGVGAGKSYEYAVGPNGVPFTTTVQVRGRK